MNITIIIRSEVLDVDKGQDLINDITAKLSDLPNLIITGNVTNPIKPPEPT